MQIRTVALFLMPLLLAGCVAPNSLRSEYEHTSHPFAGPPFGPSYEEDWLDTLNVIARWQKGRLYGEAGLGYKLTDGGFYGPNLTFTGRVGVELWHRE